MKQAGKPKKSSMEPMLLPTPLANDELETALIYSVEGYLQNVNKNVAVYDMLFKNSMPQRCMRHNNILSLYCETERSPLCVSCMYHSSEHKGHKVVPLKNATKLLTTDTQNYRNKLQKRIYRIEDVIRVSTENLVKIYRIYPELCAQIEMNFRGLYERLKQKELEQLRELFLQTERLRSNHLVVIEYYNKLICYYIERDPPETQPDDEDGKVYSRNMLSTLIESARYQEINVKSIEFFDYPQSRSEVFKDLESYMIDKLYTNRFPDVITIDKQGIDLSQTFNINARDQIGKAIGSPSRSNTPRQEAKPRLLPRSARTPYKSRSINGSFRISTSKDIA